MRILVTGAAGFIGFHACKRFLAEGHEVVGIDNLNDYYSPKLKEDRLAQLKAFQNFRFSKLDLADAKSLNSLFEQSSFSHAINMAAQAGVRYSLTNPDSYVQSNIVGFANLLECCRHNRVAHLIYASSSSVYGLNSEMPFSTSQNVDHPVSLYAASKKSNELMAHTYSYLYGLPTTGLRLFTVYGPWGRPDMALYIFTKAILEKRAIPVFNEGKMLRDFTYIDDVIDGIYALLNRPPAPDSDWNAASPNPASSCCPYAVYNIGNNQAISLMDFIHQLEETLGEKAALNLLPMQSGDVPATYANIDPLRDLVEFTPKTLLRNGLTAFVDWYKRYYQTANPVSRETARD